MGVVSIDVKKDGRQIKQTFTGSYLTQILIAGSNYQKTTTPVVKTSGQIVYSVLVDRKDAQPITILSDYRLPQLGAQYVENGVIIKGVNYMDATPRFIGPRGRFWEWEVAYTLGGEFSNAPTSGSSSSGGEKAATLLNFSTSMELEDYAVAADLDGVWNCNSIGEFFADPLIVKTGILSLNYSRREYQNPLVKIKNYFQTVNNAAIWGFAAGTLKVADISFSAAQTTEETTYDVQYKIQYRPKGWNVEKANSGLYYNNGTSIVRALNNDGSPVDQPILLALDGTKLASGAAVPMRSYRVNNLADFAGLDLPSPFEV